MITITRLGRGMFHGWHKGQDVYIGGYRGNWTVMVGAKQETVENLPTKAAAILKGMEIAEKLVAVI